MSRYGAANDQRLVYLAMTKGHREVGGSADPDNPEIYVGASALSKEPNPRPANVDQTPVADLWCWPEPVPPDRRSSLGTGRMARVWHVAGPPEDPASPMPTRR
jgi:hypothetical protein